MNKADRIRQVALDWKVTRPEIDPRPMVRVLAVLRSALELEKATEKLFARYDLNTATFGVLATLRRSSPPEGMTLSQLAQFVLVTPASITNRVDRLEARGLVERYDATNDRRCWLVRLTQKGYDLINELIPQHVENERQLLSGLNEQEQEQLYLLLLKLLASLEDD